MVTQSNADNIVFKKTLMIALSDQEFDTAALESLGLVLPQSTQVLDLVTSYGSMTLDSRTNGNEPAPAR